MSLPAFPVAFSTNDDPLEAVKDCLARLPANFEATLGFVYATDEHAGAMSDILRTLRAETGILHWVGTVGIGICCNSQEFMDEPALAMMLTDFPQESFHVFDGVTESPDQIDEALASWPAKDRACLTVVHGDPNNASVPDLIEALPARLGNGFLVGGLTSSRLHHTQLADSLSEGGLSGVVFDQDIAVASALSQGCSPISPTHTITKCQHNIIAQLDGEPALDVFREDIGELLSRDLEKIAGFIFAARPVRGVDTGDYMVRNLVAIDPENKLLAVGDMFEAGDQLLFCQRDSQTALEDLQRMLSQLKDRLGEQKPRGALYFTCLGRGQHMFGEKSRELEIIQETLGDVPLVGFYANGEISHDRLYGYTGVLTLFL